MVSSAFLAFCSLNQTQVSLDDHDHQAVPTTSNNIASPALPLAPVTDAHVPADRMDIVEEPVSQTDPLPPTQTVLPPSAATVADSSTSHPPVAPRQSFSPAGNTTPPPAAHMQDPPTEDLYGAVVCLQNSFDQFRSDFINRLTNLESAITDSRMAPQPHQHQEQYGGQWPSGGYMPPSLPQSSHQAYNPNNPSSMYPPHQSYTFDNNSLPENYGPDTSLWHIGNSSAHRPAGQ